MNPFQTALLYLCFFISGMAGLLYEVLWEKYLALYVGGTGLAQIIVLATFMGGLAMGSHFLGRSADRAAHSLRFYAFLEFGIGIYALLFDRIFIFSKDIFLLIARLTDLSASGLAAAKIVSCILSILFPAFLMGGTMPALARHIIREIQGVGSKLSRLYFVNSFGAVIGCLLAGFFLIRTYGLNFSMIVGSGLSIGSGVIALAVLTRERAAVRKQGTPVEPVDECAPHDWRFLVVLLCVAVSGAVSMMYEVAWIRLLTLVLGASTYSFSVMLATFILGLSLGGLILSFRRRATGYTVIFGLTEVFVGLTVMLAIPFYARLPYVFNQAASCLSREPGAFGLYQLCKFFLCGLVMIVPTVLQGITLPAAAKALTHEMAGLGGRIGLVFAVNTVGALVGVVFTGFFGLPSLGIKGTLELAIVINGIVGLAVLCAEQHGKARRRAILTSIVCMTGCLGLYGARMGDWDREVVSAGAYRIRQRIPSYGDLLKEVGNRETIFYRDGLDATIVVQDVREPVPERLLVINGKVDASTVSDLTTQKMLAHIPMLCRAGAADLLIVGLGSGATVGSALAHDVRRVDIVEISRDVMEAARLFHTVNGRYWENPRARVFWEDAKTFLQVTDFRYDIIISEPTNPWIAGVAGVFSREYFEECLKNLAPDGLFAQWFHASEIEDATFYMILETFSSVFPCYTMWNPSQWDVILVGSPSPYSPDIERMRAILARGAVAEDLSQLGIESLLPILAMQMSDNAGRYSHVPWMGAIHSDFFPVLEYVAPRGFFVGSRATGARWMDGRAMAPANAGLWLQAYLDERVPSADELRNCYSFVAAHGGLCHKLPFTWALEWAIRHPADTDAVLAMASNAESTHASSIKALNEIDRNDFASRKLRCSFFYSDYMASRTSLRTIGANAALTEITALALTDEGADDQDVFGWRGELQYDLGMYSDAAASLHATASILHGMMRQDEKLIRTGVLLCRALLALDDASKARAAHDKFLRRFHDDLRARLIKAEIEAAARK